MAAAITPSAKPQVHPVYPSALSALGRVARALRCDCLAQAVPELMIPEEARVWPHDISRQPRHTSFTPAFAIFHIGPLGPLQTQGRRAGNA